MITTPRLFIRRWQDADAEAFYGLSQDSAFNLYPITKYRQESVATARAWIKSNVGKYGVWEQASGALVGMGGHTPWEWEGEALVDITYRLRASAHGQGLGSELAQALVDHAFQKMKLKEITATITPDNIPSKKIAEKLGFKFDKNILLLGVPTELYRLLHS